MTITFKKMSEYSIEECVQLWTAGFEGYLLPMNMNIDAFIARTANNELSMENSIVILVDDVPAGFVMNSIREIGGKKVAWNGGTGVAMPYRKQGIGRLLMQRNLELYRELEVDIATLEALSPNEKAINLYKHVGYEVIDEVTLLQNNEALSATVLETAGEQPYTVTRGMGREAGKVSFYLDLPTWSSQWQSVKDGETVIVREGDEIVGYALYKQTYDKDSKLTAISLFQCEACPDIANPLDIYKVLLREVYGPLDHACRRGTFNLRKSNPIPVQLLGELGFTTYTEQVFMTRSMEK
ncbi:GNAT family N-acetyltransferase [Paenibacillus sp. N1-5-1-14]|uniref:GNAT family N-acetyltransferase n=1 Tax=Paenibacillus radicibacter TaxID=2972488 RepID=UPI002158BEB4|nr:GNAT family N-acetyltransferase [Paenibacillus radicibacter]MCR8641041.1 GNAT family N-acetyltransferase [Paenibacillus radicibacter]